MARDPLLSLTTEERLELFTEAAARRGLHPMLIEKDYWVVWLLGLLFDPARSTGSMIFKGGTSLSKAYDLIQRFSEDIDLAFDKAQFGFKGDKDPEGVSKKKAAELIDDLATAVAKHVGGSFREDLAATITTRLGAGGWALEVDDQDPSTLLFVYPQVLGGTLYSQASYVKAAVRLEIGARSDPWPAETRPVLSYAAEEFPALLGETPALVNVLSPERTFWEKATILHAEAHRDGLGAERASRHYYDLVQIARSPHGETALADTGLRERVVAHKSLFFRSGWARYDLAKPPTFVLVPSPERLKALAADYRSMNSMFFEDPPSFENLVTELLALQEKINAAPSAGPAASA
uniref:Nucleotidyl transferase AbiEii/AbiGii toxin family protein n=1 Tax=Caulobacter sp. (strain K31) TaxID=366602 RepID=B0T9L0_CAUSK